MREVKLQGISRVAEKNYSLLTSTALISQGINILFILNLITAGKLNTSSYILYISIVIVLSIIIAIIEKKLDGGLAPILEVHRNLQALADIKIEKKANFMFYITIIINILAVIAACINIIEHALNPARLNGNWVDQHRTLCLGIIVGLMVICLAAKIFVQNKLRLRENVDPLCQAIINKNCDQLPETKDCPEIKYNANPFVAPKANTPKLWIANWSAVLVAGIVTAAFAFAANTVLPNMPVYFYIAASFLLALSIFFIAKVPFSSALEKLGETEESYQKKVHDNFIKIKHWLNNSQNIVSDFTTRKKIILKKYWEHLKEEKTFRYSFSPTARFYNFVFTPMFNFIAIAIPIIYGISTIFQFFEINIPAIVLIAVACLLAFFYSLSKTSGNLCDEKQGLFWNAHQAMMALTPEDNAANIPRNQVSGQDEQQRRRNNK